MSSLWFTLSKDLWDRNSSIGATAELMWSHRSQLTQLKRNRLYLEDLHPIFLILCGSQLLLVVKLHQKYY